MQSLLDPPSSNIPCDSSFQLGSLRPWRFALATNVVLAELQVAACRADPVTRLEIFYWLGSGAQAADGVFAKLHLLAIRTWPITKAHTLFTLASASALREAALWDEITFGRRGLLEAALPALLILGKDEFAAAGACPIARQSHQQALGCTAQATFLIFGKIQVAAIRAVPITA